MTIWETLGRAMREEFADAQAWLAGKEVNQQMADVPTDVESFKRAHARRNDQRLEDEPPFIPVEWESLVDDVGYLLGQRMKAPGAWIYRFYGGRGLGMNYVVVQDPLDWQPQPERPTHLALELPLRRNKEGKIMPNFELPNDEVVTITIKTTNANGDVEPVPSGDTFTVTSSNDASLTAAIGQDANGAPAIVLTPLVQQSPGLTVTVTDSAGLAQVTQIVDIVPDVTPTNIVLDLADATHTMQPAPTNPGP